MRGEFYQQLTNDLETKVNDVASISKQISLWLMEATSLTFVPTTISDWRIIRI